MTFTVIVPMVFPTKGGVTLLIQQTQPANYFTNAHSLTIMVETSFLLSFSNFSVSKAMVVNARMVSEGREMCYIIPSDTIVQTPTLP